MINTNDYQAVNVSTTMTDQQKLTWRQKLKNRVSTAINHLTFWLYEHRLSILIITVFCVAITTVLFPEQASANKIDDQLDAIDKIFTEKVKKYGISIATISGGIWALVKGNIKLMGVIIIIGVALAYFLKWVGGGMTLA